MIKDIFMIISVACGLVAILALGAVGVSQHMMNRYQPEEELIPVTFEVEPPPIEWVNIFLWFPYPLTLDKRRVVQLGLQDNGIVVWKESSEAEAKKAND